MNDPSPPRDGHDDEQKPGAPDSHNGVPEEAGELASESNGTLPEGVIPLHPAEPTPEPAPGPIAELAAACVRFVQAAVGVPLDFRPETLPLLDHYLTTRREELVAARAANPEAMGLVARAAAAYFGEVVRSHFRSFWHLASDDPSTWEVRFESVYLSVNPLAVVYDAIAHGDEEGPIAYLELEDEDREAVAARLNELPLATDDEFFSLGPRLEVLEIAVDVVKSRMMASGLGEVSFAQDDYEN
ncbi:MAG: hypothetical protein ABW133_20195 [Polyangiaceae bacterium]